MTLLVLFDSRQSSKKSFAPSAPARRAPTPKISVEEVFEEIEEKAREGFKEQLISKKELNTLRDIVSGIKEVAVLRERSDQLNNLINKIENIQIPDIDVFLFLEILEEEIVLLFDDDLKRKITSLFAILHERKWK